MIRCILLADFFLFSFGFSLWCLLLEITRKITMMRLRILQQYCFDSCKYKQRRLMDENELEMKRDRECSMFYSFFLCVFVCFFGVFDLFGFVCVYFSFTLFISLSNSLHLSVIYFNIFLFAAICIYLVAYNICGSMLPRMRVLFRSRQQILFSLFTFVESIRILPCLHFTLKCFKTNECLYMWQCMCLKL